MALLFPTERNASFPVRAENPELQRWGMALSECPGGLNLGGTARTEARYAD